MERQSISAHAIRCIILEQSKRANVGHIGSNLCIAAILAALYDQVLAIEDPSAIDRDRFVLSKGHAALALYAALYLKGWLGKEDLDSFCQGKTPLGVHPEHVVRGVDFTTGSLGQGLSIGVGCAMAARLQNSSRRVFVLLSDAELNEGSVWEAIMFAGHHQLSNLVVIVDVNGQQALGKTRQVLELEPLEEKWQMFSWEVHRVFGDDQTSIANKLLSLNPLEGAPKVVLADTTFGKGVSFMEGDLKWHYWPMSEEEYEQALKEVTERE